MMNREELERFHLPTYKEIPAVGLYLDQTSKYINEALEGIEGVEITNSMISNYVKQHLITNPVKKQYGRDQIATLIFISVSKSVLSLDDVRKLIELQKKEYTVEESYMYFYELFESYNAGNTETNKQEGIKGLLRSIVAHVVSNIQLHRKLKALFKDLEEE